MSRTATRPAARPKPEVPAPAKPKETWRDLIEQIVVAVILAILIRGFDAEAFVIPTGSMAPTLMGRHHEVACPQCGHVYAINDSEETEDFVIRAGRTETGVCVNCRFLKTDVREAPSFKGDRILVMKFPYEMPWLPASAGPRRWDVVVFHYPEKPEVNYIKRLVGMPDEDLRVFHGDIQTRPRGANRPFQIERKPLRHQQAMQMLVHDDTHRAKLLRDSPEWERWKAEGGWKQEKQGQGDDTTWSFVLEPTPGQDWADLRYRHIVADPEQWAALSRSEPLPRAPRASLITDFYSYNTNVSPISYDSWLQTHDAWLQPNWVGDLTVSCQLDVTAPGGQIRFELIEAGVANRCEVDLQTGMATLYHGSTALGQAPTSLKGTGSHAVAFANVDDRLTLWVDGRTPFGEGLPFADGPDAPYAPTAADLSPVAIAARGTSARVSDLVLKRDIYYTQDPKSSDFDVPGLRESLDREADGEYGRIVRMFDFLADPSKFAALKDIIPRESPYAIMPDHFLMMGDNSPRSSDSRAWGTGDVRWRDGDRSSWEVPRSMLIGKAFFVYWPHGKPFGPHFRLMGDIRFPFRPYFERMKWIR